MIKGPKNATPTLKGWVSPKGELLKAQKISQAQLDEYFGVQAQPEPQVLVEAEPVVEETVELQELLVEAPTVEEDEIDITPVQKKRKGLAARLKLK